MKTSLKIAFCVLLMSFSTLEAKAQYKTFRIILKETGKFLTNDNGTLIMADKRTGENGLSQLFIIKREDDNKIWIASAYDNNLYVKRSSNNVVLGSYSGTNDGLYRWQLDYAGGIYVNFTLGDSPNLALKVTGAQIGFADPAKLSDLNDTAADSFRFKLEEVDNTF